MQGQHARDRIRVAVLGTGTFAETCHLPGLQSHPQAEVRAIYGRRRERAQHLAERFNIPIVSTDYEELFDRSDIDAVTIVTPNVFHAKQACLALASGKHVFCEKPLGINVSEAREMVRVAEASGKIHQVAFTYRYLFGVRELRRRLYQGDIGVPHYIRAHYDCWDGLHPTYSPGFRDKQNLAGGGVLYDVGPHLFDLVSFVLGPLEAVTGFSMMIPRHRANAGCTIQEEIETDDLASAWFVHESGVRGQWFGSRATPPLAERSFLEVIGDEGAFRASLSRGGVDVLKVSTPSKPTWDELCLPDKADDESPHCLGAMMRSFVDACLRGKLDGEIDASFYDGLAAQEGVAAVETAMAHMTWVRIKDIPERR